MEHKKAQPEIDTLIEAITEVLDQVLQNLERLSELRQYLQAISAPPEKPSICQSCDRRQTCNTPCSDLIKALPGIYQGASKHENSVHYLEDLAAIKNNRRLDMFEPYDRCKTLTDKEYEAAYLCFHEGKTHKEIAKLLDRSRSTITNRLRRARAKKEDYDRNMREERLKYHAREKNNET